MRQVKTYAPDPSEPWRQLLGPQAERVHADCLHRPGNLSLTAYNQELSNHPFKEKRKRYAQSNIVITANSPTTNNGVGMRSKREV